MQHQEDAVRRQMAQFFEATSDAILFLNRDYVFTFVNRRGRELLAPSGDVVGRSVWEAFPAAAHPDDPSWINYHRVMDEGVSAQFETFYPEPLNRLFEVNAIPSDQDGIIIFVRDVTDERRDRAELGQRREVIEKQLSEIEAVYRTAPIGLALFDLDDYHYLRLNDHQAAFFGLKPEDIVGKTLTQMAPVEGLRELFDQAAAGKPVINYPLEGTLVTDPDDYRYWTVSYFPVTSADGTITGVTAASLEITQQKKAEQALIESDKLAAVGRLAASIAHEINNPLESVTNLLYLAKHSRHLDEIHSYLETAERELLRVAAITSQTLRFHKQATSPQEITGEQLIANVLSIYQGRILNSGVEITLRHRDRTSVRCFEGEIRQVISNLVGNALDAFNGASGGRLFLRSREGIDHASGRPGTVLTVADTGSGMSPETLSKVFRPFYTTKGITGTGLGLWISKEIIDRHKGHIRARSSQHADHCGTVFTIFLPHEAATR